MYLTKIADTITRIRMDSHDGTKGWNPRVVRMLQMAGLSAAFKSSSYPC